ncbi:MAG: YigZ family protein [Treponemataceae bacterium]
MLQLVKYSFYELEIKRSLFLAEGFPVRSASEAREIIKAQRAKYKDARHVVHAFSIGKNAEVLGSSDDGEPAGTAGAPALKVIQGMQVTNALVTITRWFGGILLGTGGLVKAYSESTRGLLDSASLEKIIEKTSLDFSLDYAEYNLIQNSFTEFGFEVENTDFGTMVIIKGKLPEKKLKSFALFIKNATNGRVDL